MRWPPGIFWVVLMVTLGISSCIAGPNLTTQQSLFDTQTRYTTLGAVVLHYVSQPLCREVWTAAEPCADEPVVRALQRVDGEVFNVLLAAEAARGTLDEEQYRALAASALRRLRAVIVQHAIKEVIR